MRYKKLNLKRCTFNKWRNGIQYFLYKELFRIFIKLYVCISLIISNLILAKFSLLVVLLNSLGKLCRLSYCLYISLNSSKTILKQNMEKMEETFTLLALLTIKFIVLIWKLSYQNVVLFLNTGNVLVIVSNWLIST